MGPAFELFQKPHRGDLYVWADPTVGHLQHYKKKKKTNARQMPRGEEWSRLELTEPLS